MVWATDDIGMSILLDPSLATKSAVDDGWATADDPVGLTGCYTSRDAAVHAEIGTTGLIRSQGYDVDVMMTAYQAEHGADSYCQAHNGSADVLYDKAYFGANIHPYETIFEKTNRHIDSVLLERLTDWHRRGAKTSWDVCV